MSNANAKTIFRPRKRDLDMTEGSIPGRLIKFALPLLAGNLFQQLYNMVDTWVIGQSGDNAAYAAVGSVGPIINILIGFFLGLSSGAGVVISQFYGAGNREKVKQTVHTAMLLTLILSAVFTVVGVCMTPSMLHIMLDGNRSDPGVFSAAQTYLFIYFAGVTGLLIYNIGAGILRAVGDSARPFYFLMVSAVTNTVLDLLFVFKLGMGVVGVALATVIAQLLSAILTMVVLLRTEGDVRVEWKKLKIHRDCLRKILKVGIPAAVQMAITAFSNVFVQSYIAGVNGVQTYNLGGWTTYTKVDQFIFLPLQSLALSVTTFVGQNLGKGDVKRAKKGTYVAYGMATGVTILMIAAVVSFAAPIASVFNPDEHVVATATILLHDLTPFYLLCCVNQIFSGSLRGAGDSTAPMILMLASFVGFRQIYLFIVSNYISNDLLPIAFSYPCGWALCCIGTLLYFKFCRFGSKKLVETKE